MSIVIICIRIQNRELGRGDGRDREIGEVEKIKNPETVLVSGL